MWSVWLVFCDCGFHSVCPLTDKEKRLMEASWWERLTVGETESYSDRRAHRGFPVSSVGKESTFKEGDPGFIPGSRRSAGEVIGYSLQYSWTSLVAQLVKNLPAMWETWVWSLDGKVPWRREQLPTPVFWPRESQLKDFHFHFQQVQYFSNSKQLIIQLLHNKLFPQLMT